MNRTHALAAGLLYAAIIVCGVGGEALVRAPILVDGDPAGTAANLLGTELAFRASILVDVVMVLADVALGVLLFFLLRSVSVVVSALAMAFRLAQASVLGLNLLNLHTAVSLVHSEVLGAAHRDALVTSFLRAHAVGYDLGLFFFGVDCLLVAYLVYRAEFFPRWAGVLLGAAGVVYLAGSTARIVAPDAAPLLAPAYAIPLAAELAFCALLFVRGLGARPPLPAAPA